MNKSTALFFGGTLLLGACNVVRPVVKVPVRSNAPAMPSVSIPQHKPTSIEDACDIMAADSTWRNAFIKTHQAYGAPPHVVMAILYQESRFVPNARPSTGNAYGYAQALNDTWDWYKMKSGNADGLRDHLPDAVDFVGWYLEQNNVRTNVSKWDARNQYLAYHEGTGGYLNDSHNSKDWLLKVADKVNNHAIVYRKQLAHCYHY